VKGERKMKKSLWVVVANSSIAKVFKKESSSLTELKVLEHPESRLHNRDLVSDKPGREFESFGTARHALDPQHTPHEVEAMTFAKEVASFLQAARNNKECDALYLAASPSMLGLLRQELDSETQKLIESEVDKDFTQMKPSELFEQFTFTYL